jgi:hypothetical protein
MAAVKALAWFPAAAVESAPTVRSIARGRLDPVELANAILCLGILDRYLQDSSDDSWLRAQLSPERPSVVRITAAISLGVLLGEAVPAEALAVLLPAIQDPERTNAEGMPVRWHWLGLVAHASAVIKHEGPTATETVVAALCRSAERVYESMARAVVFRALLNATFPEPIRINIERDPRTGFRRLDPTKLSAAQLRALQAIGRSPVWQKQPFSSGRLMDVGLEYGLPWDPEEEGKKGHH